MWLAAFWLVVSDAQPLLVSSGLAGDMVSGCRQLRQPALLRVAAARAAHPEAIYIDAGDLLGVSYLSRALVASQLPAFAELLHELAPSALAVGRRDLAGDRKTLLQAAAGFAELGMVYVLSNITCDGSDLCNVTAESAELADHTILLAAISPGAEESIGDKSGFTLSDPLAAIRGAAALARDEGAKRIIAVYDPALQAPLDDAFAFAKAVAGAVDVVILHGVQANFSSAQISKGTRLIVAPAGDATLDGEPSARAAVPEKIEALSRYLNASLCAANNPVVQSKSGLNGAALVERTLDVMRQSTHAEVAILNRQSVQLSDTLPPPLGTLDVYAALPFTDQLRVASIKGADLKKIFLGNKDHLLFRGFDGSKVNGRELDATSVYKVVTVDFLAAGGDGRLSGIRFTAADTAPLPELVWRSLKNAAEPFDLSHHTRWWVHYTLQLDLSSTAVKNPDTAALNDTQLLRAQAFSLGGDSLLRVYGDHPDYSLENTLELQYGLARTIPIGGPDSGLVNNTDLIAGRTTGVYRSLFGAARWYEPKPYAELYVESEFTKPDTRAYHHLMFQPTAGLRLELTPLLSLYAGGGAGWEALATPAQLPAPAQPIYPVLVWGWRWRPQTIAVVAARPLTAESNLDALWTESLGVPGAQIRARARLSIPIFSIFSLSVTDDLFVHYLRLSRELWGVSNDLTAGFAVAYDGAFQAFQW